MRKRALKKNIITSVCCVLFILAIVATAGPIFLMIVNSFKPPAIATARPPVWIFTPTLDNYKAIFKENVLKYFINSAIIATGATFIAVVLGSFAAYSLARFRTKYSRGIAFYILSLRMLPPIAVAVPFFIIFKGVGLIDTHIAVIITHLLVTLPLAVWLIRGYISSLPREIEEASLVDGCSTLGAIRYITLPLIAPGMAAVTIFCFILSWNNFLYALILTGPEAKTLPVSVTTHISRVGIEWGGIFASISIVTLPVLIFGALVQKHLVQGMTFGLTK